MRIQRQRETFAYRIATPQRWFHVSPHELPEGMVLTPGGGESPYPEGGGHDRVWVHPNLWWWDKVQDKGWHLYEVEPHGEPMSEGDSGWSAPAATVMRRHAGIHTAMPWSDAQNAQRTQIPGTDPTYVNGHLLLDAIGAPQGQTLDYGAGLCRSPNLTHPATGQPLNMVTYEPFARQGVTPHFDSPEALTKHIAGNGGFNRLMALNVINTIEPGDEPMRRNTTVRHIGSLLAPGGHALLTTRGRDVLTTRGTPVPEDDPDYEPWAIRNVDAKGFKWYQKGFHPQELSDYVQGVLGEGYTVRPVSPREWRQHTGKGGPPAGVVVVRH